MNTYRAMLAGGPHNGAAYSLDTAYPSIQVSGGERYRLLARCDTLLLYAHAGLPVPTYYVDMSDEHLDAMMQTGDLDELAAHVQADEPGYVPLPLGWSWSWHASERLSDGRLRLRLRPTMRPMEATSRLKVLLAGLPAHAGKTRPR